MKKKLEWTEHKAPPLPILEGSTILADSLYLYGVDFMSTGDVKAYFKRYTMNKKDDAEDPENKKEVEIQWINDSSCVVKLPSAELA